MSIKTVLYPTKEKIVVDIILSFVLIALSLSLPSLGIQKIFIEMKIFENAFNTLLGLVLTIIIYYPLTSGLLHVYKVLTRENYPYKKPEKINKKDAAWAVLFILLLNPLSISGIYSTAFYIKNQVLQEPCGLEIIRFTENSQAKISGIRTGEIIKEANSIKISTKDDLTKFLEKTKPGEYANIKTSLEDYRIKILQDPFTRKNIFGIIIKERYCKRIPKVNN